MRDGATRLGPKLGLVLAAIAAGVALGLISRGLLGWGRGAPEPVPVEAAATGSEAARAFARAPDAAAPGLQAVRNEHTPDRTAREPRAEEASRPGEPAIPSVQTVVSGEVRARGGGGVSGATVEVASRRLGARHHGRTDRLGRFELRGVPSGGPYVLTVPAKDSRGAYTRAPLEVPPEGLSVEIVLEEVTRGRLTGYMVDARGNPIPGVELRARSSQTPEESQTVRGDEEGYFELEIATGEIRFSTASIPRMHVRAVELAPRHDREVRLVLDRGDHDLRGRVLDESGQPLAGALLKLSWVHREAEAISGSSRVATSDPEGFFAFAELGPGPHRLTASASGRRGESQVLDVFGSQEVEIRLGRGDPTRGG